MKKLNKKGFTLIELLAVIVIMAILVAVAIPAVTRYLDTARKGTYYDNVSAAVNAVRTDVTSQFGSVKNTTYALEAACYTEKTDGTITKNTKTKDTCSGTSRNETYKWYTGINDLLEKKLKTSSFGAPYNTSESYIQVIRDTREGSSTKGSYYYYVCIIDDSGYAIEGWADEITDASVTSSKTKCIEPFGTVTIADKQ